MRKYIFLLIALLLALSLCGCETVTAPKDTTASAPPPSPEGSAIDGAATTEELMELSKSYMVNNDYENALLCVNKMIRIDPALQEAYYFQAEIRMLLLSKQYEELNDSIEQGMEHVDSQADYADFINGLAGQSGLSVVIPFTHDYRSPGEINTYGITAGNQTNAAKYEGEWRGGLLTWQGNWVYLSRPDENFAIYKMRADGGDYQRVGDARGSSLNVVGDYIYYINVEDYTPHRIRTDGNMAERLTDDECAFLSVENGYMFYDNGNDDGRLYKACLDDVNDKQKLSNGTAMFASVTDGWVYYAEKSIEGGFYRVSVDGGEEQNLAFGFIQTYCIADGFIYYIDVNDPYGVRRVRADGTGYEMFFPTDVMVTTLNAAGGTMYIGLDAEFEEDGFYITRDVIAIDIATKEKLEHYEAGTEPLCTGPGGGLYFLQHNDNLAWYMVFDNGSPKKIGN
ncbi:MAG: DUF5050 domain-containing protein [Christensenellales bacterium]